MRVRLRNVPEAQALVKRECSTVLQSGGENDLLVLGVGASERVAQQPRAETLALVRWMNLNLADFDGIRPVKKLDHSHRFTVYLYAVNLALCPTLGAMPLMPLFVPSAPCREEQLVVNRSTQLLQPGLVCCCRGD